VIDEERKRVYQFGAFLIDVPNRTLSRESKTISLRRKVFDTLVLLIEKRGRVVDKDEMMKLLWPDSFVEESNLVVSVSELRKVLGDRGGQRFIATVPGRGYRFVAPVVECQEEVDAWQSGPKMRASGLEGTTRPTADSLSEKRAKSIAVLPFKPLNPEVDDEYLGLGMADTLITRLSGIERIIIRPTSAICKYSDARQDTVAIGREQRVDAVLEGSIYRSGDRIRMTARLINVPDGASLWGYHCDEQWTSIFEVTDSIAEKIALSLLNNLSYDEADQLAKRHTDNQKAYHLYLKGRFYWNRFTREGLQKGIEYFKRAVEEDPGYALAYCGLADSYSVMGVNYTAPSESFPKARAAAIRALELDDTLAEAHVSLAAERLFFEWDAIGAERELVRAIGLNPGYASAYQMYAYCLQSMNRPEAAIARLEQAQELDPLSPVLYADRGWGYVFMRRYDEALEQGSKALEIDPHFAIAHLVIGMALHLKGLHEDGIAELNNAVVFSEDSPRILAWLGYAYGRAGKTSNALQVLDRLARLSEQRHIDPYCVAVVYTGQGETEQALKYLERACEERSSQLAWLRLEPAFDKLRSHPRFADLLGRLAHSNNIAEGTE
jgi:DNA-binding winged helix-turn-helix (wHTH) protein/Tfp pilus assembly protein PilF